MMKGNLIIGAGGHGKVIADAILRQGQAVIGFLDDDVSLIGQNVLGLPVVGIIQDWKDFSPDGLIIGIGNNAVRMTIAQRIEAVDRDVPWISVLHPNATIPTSVRIGQGTVLMAGSVVNVDSEVGCHTIINTGATIDHDCVIGDYVHIAPGAHLAGGVIVGSGAFVGIGSSIIPGCRIGERSVIGAGAAVISDIPPNVTAIGVPARWKG